MKRKPTWWKLYVFAAVSCVILFLFPPTNHALIILWTVVMFGGVMIWVNTNQRQLVEDVKYRHTIVTPPVAEFFDEDRRYLQELGTEIVDDNLHNNPHEAA